MSLKMMLEVQSERGKQGNTMSHYCLQLAVCTWIVAATFGIEHARAQSVVNDKYGQADKFRQLEEVLPTPNEYRTASGAPGHRYWQQKVDYDINVEIDDLKQRIIGDEVITYSNNSPDTLKYLWLQLDANRFHPESNSNRANVTSSFGGAMSFNAMDSTLLAKQFPGGAKIKECRDATTNKPLRYTVVGTNMRVDLAQPLAPGQQALVKVAWEYNIPEVKRMRARGGCEYF